MSSNAFHASHLARGITCANHGCGPPCFARSNRSLFEVGVEFQLCGVACGSW